MIELWGYKVFENGTIIGLNGKTIKKQKQIKIKWSNQEKIYVSYARFIYYAFNYENFNFNDSSVVITHIDGDNNNNELSNLKAEKKKNIIQGENNSSAKLTNEDVEDIKKIRKNGLSFREIASMYNVSHTLIRGIITGQLRNKQNYIMK